MRNSFLKNLGANHCDNSWEMGGPFGNTQGQFSIS